MRRILDLIKQRNIHDSPLKLQQFRSSIVVLQEQAEVFRLQSVHYLQLLIYALGRVSQFSRSIMSIQTLLPATNHSWAASGGIGCDCIIRG